jgi:hypothetical protein
VSVRENVARVIWTATVMAAEPLAGTSAREPLLGHVVGMIGKGASHVDRVSRQNARREGIPPPATAPPPPYR